METRYEAKCAELGSPTHQIVFHGTDERSNVDSILHHGFDKNRVKRVRRGFSPAWTSSSFDKVENISKLSIHFMHPQAFSFARKPGAILMNRLLLGNCWQDNSRLDIAAPYDTKVSSMHYN